MQSDKEIAGCISDIGVPFTPADLQKPNPQHIQMVFEWVAELLMNATREAIDPAMRAAAEDVCGDYMEIVPMDARNLMGFFASLRRLMVEVSILGLGIRLRVDCLSVVFMTSHSRIWFDRHMTVWSRSSPM